METITNNANATTETKPVHIVSSAGVKKSDKAREVFNDCYKSFHTDPKSVPARKDIIARLQAEAGLTHAGAATYLQNMKAKAGLVVSKKAA